MQFKSTLLLCPFWKEDAIAGLEEPWGWVGGLPGTQQGGSGSRTPFAASASWKCQKTKAYKRSEERVSKVLRLSGSGWGL